MDQNLKRKNKARRHQEEEVEDEEEKNDQMEIEPIQLNQKLQKGQMQDEDEWEDDGEVNVDFLFFDPSEKQLSSVKLLINGFLDGLSFRSSELAEIICKQPQVGTMVGGDDEDEDEPEYKKQYKEQNVFGFVSLLNIGQLQSKAVIQEILKYTIDKSQTYNTPQNHARLVDLLQNNSNRVGLLMNERILNLAPQVVPVIHTQLLEDLKWLATEDKEEFKNFDFEYLLVLTKTYKDAQNQTSKKIKGKGDLPINEIIYQKFEDFLLLQKCEFYCAYEAHSSKSQSGVTNAEKDQPDEICHRVILLIKASDYYSIIPQIQNHIGQ